MGLNEIFSALIQGFGHLLTPANWVPLISGLLIGVSFGGIPGLGAVMAVILTVPFTYTMSPVAGLILLSAIYVGGTFGGSLTAILFNIPGAPENTCTAIDGYKLTQKGMADKALGAAIISSSLGGLFSVIVLIFAATSLVAISYAFGAAEYFALSLLGVIIVSSLSDQVNKGLLSALIGVFLSTIGISAIDGTMRFTFGTRILMNGFSFIPIMIGGYSLGEVFSQIYEGKLNSKTKYGGEIKQKFLTLKEIWQLRFTFLRSSIIGTIAGAIPGSGTVLANFLGYLTEEKIKKNSDEPLGQGSLSGVVAPEAANNAGAGGAFIPLLALGIPGGAVTAVLLGTFELHGIQPGPLIFENNPELVFTLFASLFVGKLLILLFGILEVKILTKLLLIPNTIVFPIIIVFSVIGSYAVNNSYYDVLIMLMFGFVGFYWKNTGYSVAALVLGLVLGPILENNFMRGLIRFESPIYFFTRPIAAFFLIITFLILFKPLIFKGFNKIFSN